METKHINCENAQNMDVEHYYKNIANSPQSFIDTLKAKRSNYLLK